MLALLNISVKGQRGALHHAFAITRIVVLQYSPRSSAPAGRFLTTILPHLGRGNAHLKFHGAYSIHPHVNPCSCSEFVGRGGPVCPPFIKICQSVHARNHPHNPMRMLFPLPFGERVRVRGGLSKARHTALLPSIQQKKSQPHGQPFHKLNPNTTHQPPLNRGTG